MLVFVLAALGKSVCVSQHSQRLKLNSVQVGFLQQLHFL